MNLGSIKPVLAALALLATTAAFAQKTQLTVYTALETDQLKAYEAGFVKDNPTIEIKWVRDSTGVITAKLLAEKANPQADVVMGVAASSLALLDTQGMLIPYAPLNLDGIMSQYRDKKNPPAWFGMDVWGATVLAAPIVGCPPPQAANGGDTFILSFSIQNPNVMFSNDYSTTISSDQPSWTITPASQNLTLAASGNGNLNYSITVPAVAAAEVVVTYALILAFVTVVDAAVTVGVAAAMTAGAATIAPATANSPPTTAKLALTPTSPIFPAFISALALSASVTGAFCASFAAWICCACACSI